MKYLYNIAIITLLFATACKKEVTVDEPTLNIALNNARSSIGDTLVFKLGDTCKFTMDGNANHITFYNGAVGFEYENRNRNLALGKTILSFTSVGDFPNTSNMNSLKILATNKLPKRDSTSIVNAQWTDVTSRAALATSSTAVASGSIDLSDLVTNDKDSLFLAFKYNGTTGATQRTWTITNYSVNNVLPNSSYNLGLIGTDAAFWTVLGNVATPAASKWVPTTTSLKIVGGAATAPTNESWIVSKALYVGRVTPDVPVATLKNLTSSQLTNYNYSYLTTGKYKATFIMFGNTPGDAKSKSKSFNIKVIP